MKKTILVTVSIMVASLLSLAACAGAPSEAVASEATVEVTCDEFNEQATISKEVEVALDGILTVYLCSDPATTFEWDWRITGPGIVDEVDLGYESPEGDAGDAGMDVRSFKAGKKGNTTLVLEQVRPLEPEEKGPLKLNLSVTVR